MATMVKARCVKAVLRRATSAPDAPERWVAIATRLGLTPRSVQRVLDYTDDDLLDLGRADRILLAADGLLGLDCEDQDIIENA